MYLEE